MHRQSALPFWALLFAVPSVFSLPRGVERSTLLTKPSDVEKTYDYVIIGGGTSGLTVADRLTEDNRTKVLVIEYGELSDSPNILRVAGGFAGIQTQEFLYPITSVPQVNLRNRTTSVLIGKAVGGSSAVNMMMTVRGTEDDYNRWGHFFSNSSDWSWKGLLPYFRKALTFHAPDAAVAKSVNMTWDASYWGNTSGVSTSWPTYQYPATKAVIDAWREVPGVEFPPDSGSGKPGVYWYPQFMDPKTVTRSYARTGHYSNQNRPNYHLVTGQKVTKILFDGTTATGVSFVAVSALKGAAPVTTTVTAAKEVILAAGGIHSPQLLQLSGVGPKDLLTSAKIPVIANLPGVGQNFQDHPMIQATFSFRSLPAAGAAPGGNAMATIATGNAAAWLPFPVVSNRSASLAAALAAQDHGAYLAPGTDATVVAGYKAQMTALAEALRTNGTAFYNGAITGTSGSGILVDLHPLSRGTVHIDPANLGLTAEPRVDYRALANPLDAQVMADIVRFSRRFYTASPGGKRLGGGESAPGAAVQSDDDFRVWLERTLSPTEYHPVGTCAMMPRELGGVVDEQLRVYGVKNLRIVDGSIMPTLPGGNTCQTVYAVAEKAADIIKAGTAAK